MAVMGDSNADLEKKIRQGRQRRDDVYRRLGKHLEGCQVCARADSLQGPPLPFCAIGDGLLAQLAQARWDLHVAATRQMGPAPDPAAARPQRSIRSSSSKSSPRPFGTHPRHRYYSS
jgi:hypothetical protein